MGKTLPPVSQLIEQERHRWMPSTVSKPKVSRPPKLPANSSFLSVRSKTI